MEADVIVIGAGGAGMIAAMTAADNGAKVLHLEKMPRIGGVWSFRGGSFTGALTRLQFKTGIFGDSPALFYADMMRWPTSRAYADSEVLRFYCEHSGAAIDWLESLGAFTAPWDKAYPGQYGDPWTVLRSYAIVGPILRFFQPPYQKRVERGDIVLKTSIQVTSLVERGGKVVGVVARSEDGKETEHLAGAVIVATGGFGSNAELIKRNLPRAKVILTHTPAYAKGDGLPLCEKVGAAIVNMDHTVPSGPYGGGVASPDDPTREIAHVNLARYPGVIWVNLQGKRVVNEDCGGYTPPARDAVDAAPEHVLNVILDHRVRNTNKPVFAPLFGVPERPWDWFDEKAAEGRIVKKADTVEDLATKLGIPPQNLVETVARWNRCIEAQKDDEFGRKELTTKLETPPFYGIRTYTTVIASCGGPAMNDRMEVLGASGKVIPGLYCAGEIQGYQGQGTGSYHTGNIVFGWQAGLMATRYARATRRQ